MNRNCSPDTGNLIVGKTESGGITRLINAAKNLGALVGDLFKGKNVRHPAHNPYDPERLQLAAEQVEELKSITEYVSEYGANFRTVADLRRPHFYGSRLDAERVTDRIVEVGDSQPGTTIGATAKVYDWEVLPTSGKVAVRCRTFTPDYTDGVQIATQFGATVGDTFHPFEDLAHVRQASHFDFVDLQIAVDQNFIR